MAEAKTCDVLPPTLPTDPKQKDSYPKRTKAFVIDWGERKDSSLQDAFVKFQKERQRDIRQTRKMKKKRKLKRDPVRLNALRAKFIQRAKKYFGVPYARKYWPKDSPEYNSPMFLDCCGLVRQVVRDMRKDLGFRIGPWNQSYMYDTLPISLTEDKMKPGDLVFMSGIYTNTKSKKQRHNMTHVEIWLGEGQKTIGARWNNGKVQVFDSYRFSAKSFHSEQYYFKSIDTWLMGICKSYCPAHPWRRSKYNPTKKSVFNPEANQSDQNEPDEAASGDEADLDTPSSSGLDLDQDFMTCRHVDSSQSLDKDSIKSDSSPEPLGLAAEVPHIRSDSSIRHSPRQLASAGETPSVSERDASEEALCDADSISYGYLSSGSESDYDEDTYDRQTWDADSRLDYFQNSSPAFAVSYLDDSDDDLDSGISYIHSSKSSGCLSLKPPKPHPTLSSSSLPELDLDDSSHVDVPAVEVRTAWKEQELHLDKEACQEKKENDDVGSYISNSHNTTNLTMLSDNMQCLDLDNGCCYCIAECDSETCDSLSEQYELDFTPDISDYPDERDFYDLDAFDIFKDFYDLSETSELKSEIYQNFCSKTQETNACNRDTIHLESSDTLSEDGHMSVDPESHPCPATKTNSSYPELTELAVGDAEVWLISPSDADTKQTSEGSGEADNSTAQSGNSDSNPSGGDGGGGRRDGGRSPGRGGGKKTPGGRPTKLPTCSLANNMTPSFYIGGGNGVALVEAPLLALGWKRSTDKYDERYRLKWVECKSRINYSAFREGDQLVNHIANCQLLTNKMGLLNSLQEYERVTLSTKGRLPRLKMAEFVPETYRLDNRDDRETFLQVYKENEIWISKPTGMNQGKGIFLLRSKDEIETLLTERDAKQQSSKPSRPLMSRIVQRYIHNPLLLDERKFDIRAYMLISSTVPYLVLYHKGYVRLSCQKYDGEDTNLTTHLTNQFIQKKVPNYNEVKEDTAWSMDKFNEYINEKVAPDTGVEQNWVYNTLIKQMQRIMLHCFNSVKHKLQCKVGYFDLYGLDFMVDQDMKIWLIEINTNPCLATNCSALKEVIPDLIQETLYLSLECFEKSRKNQPLMPLSSLKTFTILYCGSNPNAVAPRQTRSVSPAKENNTDRNKPTQSPTIQRRGRSPVRPVPRVAITTTPMTQSPYQPRKSEFTSILNPQSSSGNNKPASSARGTLIYRTATIVKSANTTGSAQTGNSGTDKTLKANSANKNNSSIGAAAKSSDAKPNASNNKTSSDSSRQGSGGAGTANKNSNAGKVTASSKTSNFDKSSANKVSASSMGGDKASASSKNTSTVKPSNAVKVTISGKDSTEKVTTSGKNSTEKVTTSGKNSTEKVITSGKDSTEKVITSGKDSIEKVTTSGEDSIEKVITPAKDSTAEKVTTSGKDSTEKVITPAKDSTAEKVTTSGKDSTAVSKSSNSDSSEKSSIKPNTAASADKFSSESQSAAGNSLTTKPESKPTEPISKQDSKLCDDKPDVTITSSQSSPGSGDDVKLKMTHATGSASRKNRPRADTGN